MVLPLIFTSIISCWLFLNNRPIIATLASNAQILRHQPNFSPESDGVGQRGQDGPDDGRLLCHNGRYRVGGECFALALDNLDVIGFDDPTMLFENIRRVMGESEKNYYAVAWLYLFLKPQKDPSR